jgi:bifunctional non-homologous end joining protein LigD
MRRKMLAELPLDGALLHSEHMDGPDGEAMFRHAYAMGLEGIISKRADKPYRSGRCAHWLKVKNPAYERPSAVD